MLFFRIIIERHLIEYMFTKLLSWYGKKTVAAVIAVVLLLLFLGFQTEEPADEMTTIAPLVGVRLATAESLASQNSLSLIGAVRSASEATLLNERGGTVTRVAVGLGAAVLPGQILVEFSNASERAALLQAEGVYEAALASQQSSAVGVVEAETRRDSAIQSALLAGDASYATVGDVLYNTVDVLYSSPTNLIFGVRVGGTNKTQFLLEERKSFKVIIQEWLLEKPTENTLESVLTYLNLSRTHTERLLHLVDTFILVTNDTDTLTSFTESEQATIITSLAIARERLSGTLTALDGASTSLRNADEALTRATILGGTTDRSAAEAQVKQALGTLRAAQANYEKTLLRSPIRGTVNQLDATVGAYVNAFTPVVTVANNEALEVVTYVNDTEKESLFIGDSLALDAVATGTVVAIAPAIDSATKKTEVRIGVSAGQLTNGQTVRITKTGDIVLPTDKPIMIPLTAIRFENTTAHVFKVTDGLLTKHVVETGPVRGSTITITSGLTAREEFVIDARGLTAGTEVTTLSN